MFYRIFSNIIIIAVIALTAMVVTEQNTLDAVMESCNPMNESCNYQIKEVIVVHIGVHDCKDGHDFHWHVKGFSRSNMAWCSVHSSEPRDVQYFFMRCVGYPVEHRDDEGE